MSPLILSAAYVLRMLTGIAACILSYLSKSSLPPEVPSLLAGYDNVVLYVMSPCAFLSRCEQRCGPVYRVTRGSWRLVVLSSGSAISSALSASSQLFSSDTMNQKMLHAVAGITADADITHLYPVMIRELFSLLDQSLSLHALDQTTQTFCLVLLSQILDFTLDHTGPISLTQLTNEPLFNATNLVLFGSSFPSNTYRDFRTLNKSVPPRFWGTLLWHWPSYAARTRLLKSLTDYLQQGDVPDCDNHFSHAFINVFRENKLQSLEGARFALGILWVVHSNAFFSLSFLLGNQDGFRRVLAEIDIAVDKFGGLEELLRAGPSMLDDPCLQLLTSTIMETTRFTALHSGVCQATCDVDLKLNDSDRSTVSIKKGEYIFGNVHAAHMDATVFLNPEMFVVDRFA